MGAKSVKSTNKTEYPEFVTKYGEEVYPIAAAAAKRLPTEYEPYGSARVADFTSDQTTGFQKLRDLIAGAPQVGPEALGMVRTAAGAPAQDIATEGVMDENGNLGPLSRYTDPFMKAAEGPVQAAIRKISEAAATQRKGIGAAATMSGAFGDARHGVRDAELDRNTSLAIGETAGNLYSKAFSDAMSQRAADAGRFLQADVADAGFGETALDRMFKAATGLTGTAAADQQRLLQQISSLLETGGKQQANEQLGLDRDYEEFLRQYGHDFNILSALTGAMRGAPVESTTTSSKPDTSGMQLAGAALGSLLSPVSAGGTTVLGSLLGMI